jgi:hypothetical protein
MEHPHGVPFEPLVNESAAADLLLLSVRTLQRWRVEGRGPCFLKIGRRVAYRVADVEAWIEGRRRTRTSSVRRPNGTRA